MIGAGCFSGTRQHDREIATLAGVMRAPAIIRLFDCLMLSSDMLANAYFSRQVAQRISRQPCRRRRGCAVECPASQAGTSCSAYASPGAGPQLEAL